MFSDRNHEVAHSSSWDDPPEDYSCKSSYTINGTEFFCDLEEDHVGPHICHPKAEQKAVIIWNSGDDD